MSGPDFDLLREEAARWLGKAEEDRQVAELLLAAVPPLTSSAAFHVQQAVEKLLKAQLTAEGRRFPRTHDLKYLADLIDQAAPKRLAGLERLQELSLWGTSLRYPDIAEDTEPDLEEVSSALPLVARLFQITSLVIGAS